MNNVEKLKHVGILAGVRQRLGAEDDHDKSEDERINRMTNTALIGACCGWDLGDESWWRNMKANFDMLEQLDNSKNKRA